MQVQLLPISKIAVADLGGSDWLSIYQGSGLSTSWNSLRAGCKYQLRVACRNAVGYSQYSVPVTFVTAPDAPLPPPRPSALIESRVSSARTCTCTCICVWPKAAVSTAACHAVPHVSLHTHSHWLASCIDLPALPLLVHPSTLRPVRVGAGADILLLSLLLLSPPPPCVHVVLQALFINLQPPPHDGGSTVTHYTVLMRCSPGAAAAAAAAASPSEPQPFTSTEWAEKWRGEYKGAAVPVLNLLPGTVYEFRAAAWNNFGSSTHSEIGSATTLPAEPLPPQAPQLVSAAGSSLVVSWREPYGQGSPVTKYKLSYACLGPVGGGSSRGHSRSSSSAALLLAGNGHAEPGHAPESGGELDGVSQPACVCAGICMELKHAVCYCVPGVHRRHCAVWT